MNRREAKAPKHRYAKTPIGSPNEAVDRRSGTTETPQTATGQIPTQPAGAALPAPHSDPFGVGPSNGRFFTPEQVAAALQVSAEQVRAMIRQGRLTAINVGTGKKRPLYRIPAGAIEILLAQDPPPCSSNFARSFKRLPPVEDFFPGLQ